MDPVAHTFVGGTLAAAGLRKATPLATAALLIGANLPDVDGLAYFGPDYASLAFRRGWTHGVLALALWPLILTGALLLWDKLVRRRRAPQAAAARAGPLLGVATVALLTHPLLDWMNNYGLRWLMPFDGSWFYGDALFIIDPWLWLFLGGVLFLRHSEATAATLGWVTFWVAASALILAADGVPWLTRALWVLGTACLIGRRFLTSRPASASRLASDRAARGVLAAAAVYMLVAVVADYPASHEIRARLADVVTEPIETVMVAPAPGNPFAGDVVVQTPSAYYVGHWSWLRRERFEAAAEPIARPSPRDPTYAAAARTTEARRFLAWSRFPYVEVESATDGSLLVHFRDARYREPARITGPTVSLPPPAGGNGSGP